MIFRFLFSASSVLVVVDFCVEAGKQENVELKTGCCCTITAGDLFSKNIKQG